MKRSEDMNDGELVEAILLVAARARMADAGDVRKSADVLADLAIEAGARIANRRREARPLEGKISGVSVDAGGRLSARLEVDGAGPAFVDRVLGPRRWICKRCGKERRRGECLHCGNREPITDEATTPGIVR